MYLINKRAEFKCEKFLKCYNKWHFLCVCVWPFCSLFQSVLVSAEGGSWAHTGGTCQSALNWQGYVSGHSASIRSEIKTMPGQSGFVPNVCYNCFLGMKWMRLFVIKWTSFVMEALWENVNGQCNSPGMLTPGKQFSKVTKSEQSRVTVLSPVNFRGHSLHCKTVSETFLSIYGTLE